MKSLERFVECTLDQKSAEVDFLIEFSKILDIDVENIKEVSIKNMPTEELYIVSQVVVIELVGSVVLKSENLQKIKGLTFITPRTFEIQVGEIHL